jgi:transposase
MKFTQSEATNQRIERITMQHAVVGIDISKDVHAAQITDFRGRVLTSRHLLFSNTREGFDKLLNWVRDAQAKKGLPSLIVGLEPTGHYWFNLANWLLEQEIHVVLVNPVTTHRNKENRDNSPSKNDPKDAIVIADVVSRGYYTDYSPQAVEFERLQTVMSDREYWVKLSGSLGNRIVRWIDRYFPEFSHVFPDWTTLRSLASLHAFPLPSDLKGLNVDDIIAEWRKQGMKRAGGSSGKTTAAQLLAAATGSIGENRESEQTRRDLMRLLDSYEQVQENLEAMQCEIETLLSDIPAAKLLQSIEGLGTVAQAAILGLGGDPSRYAHGRQLLRRAGLNLAECTSGKFKGQIKLSKRGDSALRKYLFLAVISLVRQHPDFKRWHAQNQAKGMKKRESIFKLIGKLAHILIGMIQRGETYRSGHPNMDPRAAA